MLLVETYLNLSSGKGLGLFAQQEIKKGTIYWIRNEVFDKIITPSNMASLNNLAQQYVQKYACLEKNGNWYLCGDNARYSNHSDYSNTLNEFNEHHLIQYLIASRDIEPGDEILCNYTELCETCKLGVPF